MSKCAICNNAGTLECKCKSISYCSSKCQSKDTTHKILCDGFARVLREIPTPKAFLSISFPPTSSTPTLVWVAIETASGAWKIVEKDSENGGLTYKNLLGEGTPGIAERPIVNNTRPFFPLDHTVVVMHRSHAMIDGSVENQSISAVTGGSYKHEWAGEVLVMSRVGRDLQVDYISQHVTAVDLYVASEWFKITPQDSQIMTRIPSALGVRIGAGDVNKQQMNTLYIAVTHKIFQHKATRLSNLLQLPLIVYSPKDEDSAGTAEAKVKTDDNIIGWFLNLDLEATSETWGQVKDKKWTRAEIGDVWIVRADKKPLMIEHMRALMSFIIGLHRVLIEDDVLREVTLSKHELTKERKKLLKEEACKANFEAVFEKMKEENGWKDVESPYATKKKGK